MKTATTPRSLRFGAWAAGLLLAACGGGSEFLLLALVTPLGGAWRLNGDTNQEGLQITSPGVDVQLFASKFDVTASLLNPSDFCGLRNDGSGQLALVGSYDNGKMVLRAKDAPGQPVCIEGTVTSLIRFDAVATGARPARFYENNRVDVNLHVGVWTNEPGTVRLKFSALESINNGEQNVPLRACDLSPGARTPVLAGALNGYVKATAMQPAIPTLTVVGGTEVRFTNVVFTDGATITLRNVGGQTITLSRKKETAPTTCP